MQEKSVILTPNKRLARYLQRQACAANIKQNQVAWHSTKILPLTTWLTNCWQEYSDTRILLSTFQEKVLWQEIITKNLGEKFIGLTNLVLKSHELINDWQLKKTIYPIHKTEDIVVFQRLYKKFRKYCTDNNLITISELPTLLIPYISNCNFEKITFAGFDEYNPQLQILMSTIEETGCKVLKLDPNNYQNSVQKRLGLNSSKEEIITSAEWAKKIINKNPKSSIGIVIPNLIKLRSKISQIFTEILDDDKSTNISVGIPLNTLPIISEAIELLSLNESCKLKTISKILLSPYITGAETEKSERAFFNLQLYQTERSEPSFADIKKLAEKYTKDIPLLIKSLQKWQDFFPQLRNKTLYGSEWIKIFTQILQIFGWPGEKNLTDLESTAMQYFTKSLQEIAATNSIINKISYKKALQILNEVITHTMLQPKLEVDAPINIIGALEAAGINFDYLWVMELNQENWPPPPRPNPFIPIEIQKKFSLPHASAERELHFCETLIKRYKRSAKEIIFSYVKQAEDRIIEPSCLITDIPEISVDDLNLAKTKLFAQKIYQVRDLETLDNDSSPKLEQGEIIHASSRLIELQSLCPFRAFMEFRLATKEPKKLEFGISKINRGILIHNALEHFWQETKTQQNLCLLNEIQLQKSVQDCVEHSLNRLSLPQALRKLEKQCLISLLTRWLEIEKTRDTFKVVATEESIEINLSSILFKLRVDRIDQLTDGSNLLIDYKTGKNLPSIFDWFGVRPKNLQLLLYSIAIDSIQGLALAQINIESLKFKDISLNELIFGLHTAEANENNFKKDVTWDELIKYWRGILTKIASDFASGQSSATPSSPQVCKQCGFGTVCRIASKN